MVKVPTVQARIDAIMDAGETTMTRDMALLDTARRGTIAPESLNLTEVRMICWLAVAELEKLEKAQLSSA